MLYDVNITANNEPYIAFENLQHIPLDTVPHSQFSNAQFIVQMAASLLTAHEAPLHAQMRALCASRHHPFALPTKPLWRVLRLMSGFPLAGDSVARAVYGAHNPYAAPELALQRTADARADLFSIGITLYETITGQSFNDVAMVESSGMLSSQVLRESAPAQLPDALVQWIFTRSWNATVRCASFPRVRHWNISPHTDFLQGHSKRYGANAREPRACKRHLA